MAVVHLDKDNFKAEVEDSKIPVIIDFWAEWCGPCRMMAPVFEQLSSEYSGKLKFAKLDVQAYPHLAAGFGIQGIPALVVTKHGEEVDRIVGFMPRDAIRAQIDNILDSMED